MNQSESNDLANIQNETKIPKNTSNITTNSNSEKQEESTSIDKNQKNIKHDENYRLAGRPPLLTLVVLSVGPMISQFVSSLYGIVATIWVSRAVGETGMAAISLFTNPDNIGRAFGYFMNCSA